MMLVAFIPALAVALAIYAVIRAQTLLPVVMTADPARRGVRHRPGDVGDLGLSVAGPAAARPTRRDLLSEPGAAWRR